MTPKSPQTSTLLRYHELTKHTRTSVRSGPGLDWDNKPLAFKVYPGLEGIPPPEDLGRLCLLTNGVLRWSRQGRGEPYGFRAAPCTGALYHVELYVATGGRPDLPAGLYQYGAHDHALRRLRAGDVRGALLEAAGGFAPLASAPLVAVLTSTFWRNSWKYRARAYRHTYWDAGAVLANLLALAGRDGRPAAVAMGFADGEVDRLLGVDGEREAAVALVALGDGVPAPPPPADLPELDPATTPLSPHPLRYPEIEEAHRASSLPSGKAAAAWRARTAGAAAAPGVPPPLFEEPVDDVVRARRSTRRFGPVPLGRGQVERLLAAGAQPVPGDCFSPDLLRPFLVVNAVDGLAPGAYGPGLRPIRTGDLRLAAAGLALGQRLGAEAAADLYFMADLPVVLDRLGERGYRVAQMAGGIAGARVELCATALGLGASGLTFFDDEVTDLFEPAAEGRQVMYLVAVGQAAGPRR